MRRIFLTLTMLVSVVAVSGFVVLPQNVDASIVIINRDHQPTSQITDGDSVQIQITTSQPSAQGEEIKFAFDAHAQIIGSCSIAAGKDSCTTQVISTLGWHWDANGVAQNTRVIQAFGFDSGALGQSNSITVMPRPVVMVHGFLSNPETWAPYVGSTGFLSTISIQGFAVGDGQVSGKLNTGVITNPTNRTNTIAQNAEVLKQYISAVKQKTGAEMVDLVVHSMGGMISRYYIDRVMQDRDVAQLIMLGSPMGGSDCAVVPAALGFFLPASIEIRESYMTGVFNQQITHRRGIAFYDLGGTAILDPFKSPCTDVPNDTVVSFNSINAIALQSSQLSDVHSDLTFSEKAFQDFVKPLLQRTLDTFLSSPDLASPPQTDSPLEFTRVYTGHVDANGSTELTINIEAGLTVASFALYDASRSINTVVRGASGNVINLNPDTNGFIKIDEPSALFYLGYGFQNPKPGPWKITVQATDKTPSNGTDFAISVYFVGGAKLEAKSNTLVPRIKEQVRFEASLALGGQALEIKEAKALIKDSDGNIQTLNFPAGQNISTTWIPNKAGTYAVDIVVTGVAPDGSSVERTDFLAVEVQPNPSEGQVTFNLVAVIVAVVLILLLILFFIFRGMRSVVRKFQNH